MQHTEDTAVIETDDDYDEAEEEIHKNEEGKSDDEHLDPVSEQDVRFLYCRVCFYLEFQRLFLGTWILCCNLTL